MGKMVYRVPARTVEPRLNVIAIRFTPEREVTGKGGGVAIVPRQYGAQVKGTGFPEGKLREEINLLEALSDRQRANLDEIIDTIETFKIQESGLLLVDEDTLPTDPAE